MRLVASDSGITVRFFSSSLGRGVVSRTGAAYAFEQPRTVTIVSYDLPAGVRRVVQTAGPAGFTISYTRSVFRYEDLLTREGFRHRYEPQNAIVEVGRGRAG